MASKVFKFDLPVARGFITYNPDGTVDVAANNLQEAIETLAKRLVKPLEQVAEDVTDEYMGRACDDREGMVYADIGVFSLDEFCRRSVDEYANKIAASVAAETALA